MTILEGNEAAARAAAVIRAVRHVLEGRRVLLVDAANAFHPYLLARALGRRGLGRERLAWLRVSRAFTVHQLETLARGPLERAARDAACVILADPGALLYDPEVPAREAARIAAVVARGLRRLRRPSEITLSFPPPGRETPARLFRLQAARVLDAFDVLEAVPWDERFRRLPSSCTPSSMP